MAERGGRGGTLGPYLDDPAPAVRPVRLLHGPDRDGRPPALGALLGIESFERLGILVLAMAVFVSCSSTWCRC
jgi:hypothetical protein